MQTDDGDTTKGRHVDTAKGRLGQGAMFRLSPSPCSPVSVSSFPCLRVPAAHTSATPASNAISPRRAIPTAS